MFNVGDYIIMKRGVPYSYTKYKSTGVVVEVSGREVLVEFDYLSEGEHYNGFTTYWVDAAHCKLAKAPSQQERVCSKIKQMEARWLKFQQLKLSQKKKGCYV